MPVRSLRRPCRETPPPRFNGELMRGFGLQFDGVDRFDTTQSVDLGGITISRSVYINRGANWGRWLDTFTNTTATPLTIKVAFGGQSGIGASGGNSSAIVNTSSGDAVVTSADAWVEVATPLAGTTLVGAPQVTVLGTPSCSTSCKPARRSSRWARPSAAPTRRQRHPTRPPATPPRKAGCSTSTLIPNWLARA